MVKLSVNLITNEKIANLQNTVTPQNSLMVVIISSTYWSSDYKMFTKPYYEPEDDQYLKNCHTPFNHRLRLTLLLLSSKRTYRL